MSDSAMSDVTRRDPDLIRRETSKRLTLNVLIQGVSSHAVLTAHHIVADELEAIRPGLTRLYDQFAICLKLGYYLGDLLVVHGLPFRFWRRTHKPSHPFHHCPLLAKHGGELTRASRRYLLERGREKRVIGMPFILGSQMMRLLYRIQAAERFHQYELCRLARRAASNVWGIDEDRLEAHITQNIAFGNLREPKTFGGRLMRFSACSYGGVERRDGQFQVVARGWNFALVLCELIKGTAELICLHGLHALDDATYEAVTAEADQLEYELWMIQSGPEAWRRLLAVIPPDLSIAETLMYLAQLEPEALDELMLDVIEHPELARASLEELGGSSSLDDA